MKNIINSRWGRLILLTLFVFAVTAFIYGPDAAVMSSAIMFCLGTTYAEPNYISDVILQEEDKEASRDAVTVLSGQNLAIGTVLGKITIGAVSETHAGNTGNGAMTLDATTPAIANAQVGVYTVKCITAAANGGTFEVFDPKGNSLGIVAVAATFANQIKFVIADGATDFIVGDTFLVTVAAGSGKVKILTTNAVDGTQYAYGILTSAVDASAADVKDAAIVRDAIAKDSGIVWPGGITAAQKATALAELEAKHITVREAA